MNFTLYDDMHGSNCSANYEIINFTSSQCNFLVTGLCHKVVLHLKYDEIKILPLFQTSLPGCFFLSPNNKKGEHL